MNIKDFGATINGMHTLNDLGFVLNERNISFPVLRRNEIEIMGKNGFIDLEELNDRRVYDNRFITFKLSIVEEHYQHNPTKDKFLNLFHGRKVEIIFDDDKEFVYKGKLELKGHSIDKDVMDLDVMVEAYPYKFFTKKNNIDWLWDNFNFEKEWADDNYYNLTIVGNNEITIKNEGEIIYPIIIVHSGNINIEFQEAIYQLKKGIYSSHGIYIEDKEVLKISGNGEISIDFERNSL